MAADPSPEYSHKVSKEAGALPKACPASLTVDLGALKHNYKTIRDLVGPSCAVAGIVKADAYGLGLEPVVRALESEECPIYFVATPDEALSFRKISSKSVAVLGGLFGAPDLFRENRLIPVINTLADLDLWRKESEKAGETLPVILHIETGMNRLALTADDIDRISGTADILSGLDIKFIMSHMACADMPDHVLNHEQVNKFKDLRKRLPLAPYSLAASAALLTDSDIHFDMVRPGIALYGSAPACAAAQGKDLDIRPVVSVYARVVQVKTIKKQSVIGYDATYRFDKGARVATVAAGYADGLFRSLSNNGAFYIRGRKCPIRGRVSMDYITVEIGDLDIEPGQAAELIGPHQSVRDLATAAGTIDYEVLTALGQRYHRQYQD